MKRINISPIIKNGLKNYLVNLKYFFLPLGVLFLSIIIAFSIFLPLISKQVGDTLLNLSIADKEVSTALFKEIISKSVSSVIENNSFSSLNDKDFFIEIITSYLNIDADQDVVSLVNTLITDFSLAFLIILAGILGGHLLTKVLIRRNLAKRSIYKLVFIKIIDFVLSITIVAFATYIINLFAHFVILYALLTLLLYGLIALFEAYLVHGQGKVEIKKVLTLKNVGLIELTNFIIISLTLLISYLITLLLNPLAGAIIGITLFEIALIVTSLNAEAFVKEEAH